MNSQFWTQYGPTILVLSGAVSNTLLSMLVKRCAVGQIVIDVLRALLQAPAPKLSEKAAEPSK